MKNFWQKLNKPILALAPMAGITDSAYRLLCHKYGADVVYTEMTSIDALHYDSEKTLEMLKFSKKEKPVVIQLFGKRPECVAKAVKAVCAAGFSGIDLNFGCPARKVVAHGGGAMLLNDLNLCHELVQAVIESSTIPVSVKTRVSIGSGRKKVTVFDFIEKLKDLPVAALMLHGRTYEQAFTGPIDIHAIKEVKHFFKGIVIANGGINTPEEAKDVLEKTGADGVGIARGVYGRPWIFDEIKDYLKNGDYKLKTLKQIKKVALDHAKFIYQQKGDYGIIELRKYLCWYFRGFPNAGKWRSALVQVKTVQEVAVVMEQLS